MKRVLVLVLALLILQAAFFPSTAAASKVAKNGMVSTTNNLATKAALEILERGGNAADAAAVVQFVLGVVQPHSSGVGGGCFILYYDALNDTVHALDGREEAPNKFHGRQFCNNNECLTNPQCDCSSGIVPLDQRISGGHPVGVPGTVRATALFLQHFGSMSLKEVLQPAIKYARDGFPMYSTLYQEILNNVERLSLFPSSKELYLNPKNPLKPMCEIGETFYNHDLADTLQLVAENGSEVFYTGIIAKEIVEAVRQWPNPTTAKYGLMELNDLVSYRPVYRQPIRSTFRGHTVYGFPPPASGGIAISQMLSFLEAFDLKKEGPLTVEELHRLIDAQNAAFADRNKYVGDADFVTVPIEGLLDPAYVRHRRSTLSAPFEGIPTPISPGTPAGARDYAITYADEEYGTTHWSVVDRHGNAASFTSTIEQNFGSALVVPGRGFLLNNELTDFEAYESDGAGLPYANAPEGGKMPRRTALGADASSLGGKRPRSSMAPTLIFNSSSPSSPSSPSPLYLVTGSPGGSSIPGAVLNVVVNVMVHGLDLQEATDQSRTLAKNGATSAEAGVYEAEEGGLLAALQARGFNFSSAVPTTATYGRVQSVLVGRDGWLYGAADSLREPQASAEGF